jgi:hypothetical protein
MHAARLRASIPFAALLCPRPLATDTMMRLPGTARPPVSTTPIHARVLIFGGPCDGYPCLVSCSRPARIAPCEPLRNVPSPDHDELTAVSGALRRGLAALLRLQPRGVRGPLQTGVAGRSRLRDGLVGHCARAGPDINGPLTDKAVAAEAHAAAQKAKSLSSRCSPRRAAVDRRDVRSDTPIRRPTTARRSTRRLRTR